MKLKILFLSIVFFLLVVNSVYAAFTVSVDVGKSLTENEQATVAVTVTNPAGASTESNIVTSLSSGTSWFTVVTACSTITSLSAGQSGAPTCIIKPTSTGSDLTLTASSESQGGTTGSGSASGINVASQSGTLTASISADSSVATSATFYVGVTVTAPSANDVANARATISESGQCTVDTSYVPATQTLGNITKGTSKSPTNWKLTSSSASGTCSVTVNVVSDVGGSASPSKSITVSGGGGSEDSGSSGSSTSTGGGGGGGGGGEAASKPNVTIGEKDAIITIPSIGARSQTNFSINSPVIAVTKMEIRTITAVKNVQITIKKVDARPANVVSDAAGIINQYLTIDNVNVSAGDIQKVIIDFKVEKNWININKINTNTVMLYRYEKNDQWNKLNTTKFSEDTEKILYQAESPGLSIFVIAGESGAAIETPAEKPEEASKEIPEQEKPQVPSIVLPSFPIEMVIAIIIVGVLVLIFAIKRPMIPTIPKVKRKISRKKLKALFKKSSGSKLQVL